MISTKEAKQIRAAVNSSAAIRLSEIFDVLRDGNRCWMFRLFARYPELCVSDIASILNISVPLASTHLRVMERAGMLVSRRDGQRMTYSVAKEPLLQSVLHLYYPRRKHA